MCKTSYSNFSDFIIFKFQQFSKNEKNFVKENRKKYGNLLPAELTSNKNIFLRHFETFYVGLTDYFYNFLSPNQRQDYSKSNKIFGFDSLNLSETENNFFFCETCKMKVECFKKYKIKKLPNVLVFGFDENQNEEYLNFKLEKELNISYFKNKDQSFSIDNIDKINSEFFQTKKEHFQENIYELKGFVRKVKSQSICYYENYFIYKTKWIKIVDLKQFIMEEEIDRIVNSKNSQIVICFYEKKTKQSEQLKNIKLEMKSMNKMTTGIPLSHNLINKYLYLNEKTKFSCDFDFCKHFHLKPLYEDIYLRNNTKKRLNQNKNLTIDFTKKKLFNKTLFETEDKSLASLKYVAFSDIVSSSLSHFFLENNYISKKNLDLKKMNSLTKCEICDLNGRKFVLKRILHKALMMNFLQKSKNEPKFYIEKLWFKNYEQFLLADLHNDNLSRIFYDYNYITESINQDMEKLYKKFFKKYYNDLEILDNEFVAVGKSFYFILKGVFNSEKDVYLKDNKHLMIVDKSSIDLKNLSKEENFVFENLKIEEFNFNQIQYEQMVFLNRKMNALIDFKISTTFSIFKSFNNHKDLNIEKFYRQRSLKKIEKYFGRTNMDQLEFDPCGIIYNIFNNLYHNPEIIKTTSQTIESKVITQIDRSNLNIIFSNNNEYSNIDEIQKMKNSNEQKILGEFKDNQAKNFTEKNQKVNKEINFEESDERNVEEQKSTLDQKTNSSKDIKKKISQNNSNKKNSVMSDSSFYLSEKELFEKTKKKKKKLFNDSCLSSEESENVKNRENVEENESVLDSISYSDFNSEHKDYHKLSGLVSVDNNSMKFSVMNSQNSSFRRSESSSIQSKNKSGVGLGNSINVFIKNMKSKKFSWFSKNNSILNHNKDLDTSSEIENEIEYENDDQNENSLAIDLKKMKNLPFISVKNEDILFEFNENDFDSNFSEDKKIDDIESKSSFSYEQTKPNFDIYYGGNFLIEKDIDEISENNSNERFLELEKEMKKFEKLYFDEQNDISENEKTLSIKNKSKMKMSHFSKSKKNLVETFSNELLDESFDFFEIRKKAKILAKQNLQKLLKNSKNVYIKLDALKIKSIFRKAPKNNNFLIILKPEENKKESITDDNNALTDTKKEVVKEINFSEFEDYSKSNNNEKTETKNQFFNKNTIFEEDLYSDNKLEDDQLLNYSFNKNDLNSTLQSDLKNLIVLGDSPRNNTNYEMNENEKSKSLMLNPIDLEFPNFESFSSKLKSLSVVKEKLSKSSPFLIKENLLPQDKIKNINMHKKIPIAIVEEIEENENHDVYFKNDEAENNNEKKDQSKNKNVEKRIFKNILNNNE